MEGLGIADCNANLLKLLDQELNIIPLVVVEARFHSQGIRRNEIFFVVVNEDSFTRLDSRAAKCGQKDILFAFVGADLS